MATAADVRTSRSLSQSNTETCEAAFRAALVFATTWMDSGGQPPGGEEGFVIERAAVTSYAPPFAFGSRTIEALSGVLVRLQRRQFDPRLIYFPNREPFPEYT